MEAVHEVEGRQFISSRQPGMEFLGGDPFI